MSWDIEIIGADGQQLASENPHTIGGSNVPMNGTHDLHVSVTTNFSLHLAQAFGGVGIREALHGLPISESFAVLLQAIKRLDSIYGESHEPSYYVFDYETPEERFGTDRPYWVRAPESYFASTPGNARRCLLSLCMLASYAKGEGTWSVTS